MSKVRTIDPVRNTNRKKQGQIGAEGRSGSGSGALKADIADALRQPFRADAEWIAGRLAAAAE